MKFSFSIGRLLAGTLIWWLWLFGATQTTAAPRDPDTYFFQDTFGDLQEELTTAKEEGKQAILIFFEMDECPFCQRMKSTVLNQPEVQDYYRQHFRIFSVDIEGDVEIIDFNGRPTTQKEFSFRQHKVRATPVLTFFNLDGKQIARHTGPTAGVKEFLWLGEYVAEGHYAHQSYTRYKRVKREQAAVR